MSYPNPDLCPEHVKQSLIRYIEEGVPLGDFLQAVVADRLIESFGRADSDNRENMAHICAWVYEYMPMRLRGADAYAKHIKDKARERGIGPNST